MRLLVCLLILVFSACQNERNQAIRVITYNIRYDAANDPVLWKDRKGKVADLLQQNTPDVFGIQEALAHQAADLAILLPEFARYGVGRDDEAGNGEQTTIFYNQEKFALLDKGTFWLSETPEVPGSMGWDAAYTRICSWVTLEEKTSGRQLFAFNAHFDHKGKLARLESMKLLRGKIPAMVGDSPFVLLGDFNFEPSEAPYQVTEDWQVQDAFLAAEKKPSGSPCTFTGFEVDSAACKRIDYIFASKKFWVESCAILDGNDGTYYPSDHLPVIAELVLP